MQPPVNIISETLHMRFATSDGTNQKQGEWAVVALPYAFQSYFKLMLITVLALLLSFPFKKLTAVTRIFYCMFKAARVLHCDVLA